MIISLDKIAAQLWRSWQNVDRAIEAKPFIVIINSEDLRKKERHKVQKVMLEAIEANN